MIKLLPVIFLLFSADVYQPQRDNSKKQSIIFGANSIQKVYYTTSSQYSINHNGQKAMDSDKKSSWTSVKAVGPHWIEIDFGTKRIMTKVVVYPGKKDGYKTIKKLALQFMYKDKWFTFSKVNLEKQKRFHIFNKFSYNYGSYLDRVEIDVGGIDASTFRILIPRGETFKGYAAIAEVETYVGNIRLKYFDERLMGFAFPVKNGFLPEGDSSYPNSPRAYRGGKHVGLDIYYCHEDDSYKPEKVTRQTPVVAVDDGIIIRADWDFKPLTLKEWENQSAYFRSNPRTFVKRSFGGIQVWIDHGNGVVTTYNHLTKIKSGIKKGSKVDKGETIGFVGNSGLRRASLGSNAGLHLHFEVWIDGHYLGYGMDVKDIRKYCSWIFSIHH